MAVKITISIPDQHVTRVLNAITTLAGKNIELMVHGRDFDGSWSYSHEPQQSGETAKDFAARAIKANILAMVRLVDYTEDRERYNAAVAGIAPPEQDVPDEVIG